MIRIVPSLASSDPLNYGNFLKKLGNYGSLHLDIDDGNFIPNLSFGNKTIKAIAASSDIPLNAHLEVMHPLDYIPVLGECGCKECCFHLEAERYPLIGLNMIKSYGMKAGLALIFRTPVKALEPFIDDLDFVLIMTSEEDGKGQPFNPSSLKRIEEARKLLPPRVSIWVDGGIGEKELPLVKKAGADTVVMGRAVVREEDPVARMKYFSEF